jgi:thioredoxin 1
MENGGTLVLVTDDTFESEVIKSVVPVVVDFTADWCAPCRTAEIVLRVVSKSWAGQVKFAKLDINQSENVTRSFGIHSIPTYLFVDHGCEKCRKIGPVAPSEFRTILQRHFSLESVARPGNGSSRGSSGERPTGLPGYS